MKKLLYILGLMVLLAGCESVSAKGEHGSIEIKDGSYKDKKSKGNAYGHNNPKNPHYNGGSSSSININF